MPRSITLVISVQTPTQRSKTLPLSYRARFTTLLAIISLGMSPQRGLPEHTLPLLLCFLREERAQAMPPTIL